MVANKRSMLEVWKVAHYDNRVASVIVWGAVHRGAKSEFNDATFSQFNYMGIVSSNTLLVVHAAFQEKVLFFQDNATPCKKTTKTQQKQLTVS